MSMRWQSSLMSPSSLSPSTRCCKKDENSSRSEHLERSVSIVSKAALRISRPSSTVCLNGPRSTWWTSSGLFAVSPYRSGSSVGSSSLMADGLLCARQLSASTAPRRTLRSASSSVARKASRDDCSGGGRGPTPSSVTAQRMHAITVERVAADGDGSSASSCGTTAAGATAASRPRHSATTLRTPSSSRSAKERSLGSSCEAKDARASPPEPSISLNACSMR
mmetsp:Transcript_29072/g.74803  ORF Transcript_29072/g.74803 Transcript_29072/m.74803 type:complete len:222 (-) Transcript_29072:2803-3468(-)